MSQSMAVVTIMKAMIGAGVLALPYACGQIGLILAVPGLIATSLLCTIGTWLLIDCKVCIRARVAGEDHEGVGSFDVAANEDTVMGLGPMAEVAWHLFGSPGLVVVAVGLLSAQIGICTTYVDVITETLTGRLGRHVSREFFQACFCLTLCGMSSVRSLGKLAWLSALALTVYCFVVYVLLKYGIQEVAHGNAPPALDAWVKLRWNGIGEFLGIAIFAFEGISLAPYVFDSMRLAKPESFLWVLVASNSITFCVYGFVGVFAYSIYGDCIHDILYENFPSDSIEVTFVELVLCFVLFFSYGLQMHPVFSFVEAQLAAFAASRNDAKNCARQTCQAEVIGNVELTDISGVEKNENSKSSTAADLETVPMNKAIDPGASPIRATLSRWFVVIFTFALASAIPKVSAITSYT